MTIVKQKEKNSYHHLGLRISETMENRIDNTFNQVLIVQQDIKKSEFLRTVLERGLTEIEQQLKTVVTSNE
jgi:hypothetical protein